MVLLMKKILTIIILSFLVSMNVSATEEKWVRLLTAEDSKYPGYFYKIFVDLDSIKTGEEWGMNGELFYKQLNTFEKPNEDKSGNLTLFTNLISYEVNCSEVKKRAIFSQWFNVKMFNKENFTINALEYFGYNCQDYMNNNNYFFDNDNQVGIYMQIPIYDLNIEDYIDRWFKILKKFSSTINMNKVILLNDKKKLGFIF